MEIPYLLGGFSASKLGDPLASNGIRHVFQSPSLTRASARLEAA